MPATDSWLNLHYSTPIEDLTFGDFFARQALARTIIATVAAAHRKLLRSAAAHADLADAYQARAAMFAEY